jgi:hypothetical protein
LSIWSSRLKIFARISPINGGFCCWFDIFRKFLVTFGIYSVFFMMLRDTTSFHSDL